MKTRYGVVFALFAVCIAIFPHPVQAQEEGLPFSFANFGLEIYGGFSKVNPKEFNSISRYEESYLKFFTIDKYEYLYGKDATTTRTGDSRIGSLDHVLPFGVRLTYKATPTLSLSIGIQRVKGDRSSTVGMVVTAPDGSGAEYRLPSFQLSASGWIPELQARFGWNLLSALRFELFIGGGPIFAECRSSLERRDIIVDSQGRRYETTTILDMTGRNTGICGELGARLRIRPLKFLSLFAEGGFTFRHTSDLKGPGTLRTEIRNPGAEPIIHSENWDDKLWYLVPYEVYRDWGRLYGLMAGNNYDASYWSYWGGTTAFFLDISGFQLKAGIAIGL